MKKLLFILPLFLILSGCSLFKNKNYGTYNVGICRSPFLETTINVTPTTIEVVAVAYGPDNIEVLSKPVVFKYTETINGKRSYVNARGLEFDIYFKNGELLGDVLVHGEKDATLHGIKGVSDNISKDGTNEFKSCMASGEASQN